MTAKNKKATKKTSKLVLLVTQLLTATFYFLCLGFLIFNIYSSQTFPEVFYRLVQDDRVALINFFKRARPAPQFFTLYQEMKNVYNKYNQDIKKESRDRQLQIATLKKSLETNPQSRDILFALYLLYQAEGDAHSATQYLQKAQTVDPNVGN